MKRYAQKKTILIVDDSGPVLDMLEKAFDDAGWDVGVASDGEEVFRKFAALQPAVTLLDVVMPKISGSEVCRLIKGHPQWRDTFLVIMSSRITRRDEATYRRLGADDVLKKPFEAQSAVVLAEGVFL